MADLSQTAANVGLTDESSSTSVSVKQAGEALTQGQPVYLNSNKYYQCQGNTVAAAACVGICLTPAATDEYFVLAPNGSVVDLGGTLSIGETYAISATKGAIAPVGDLTSSEYVTTIGTAKAADTLKLVIDQTETLHA